MLDDAGRCNKGKENDKALLPSFWCSSTDRLAKE